MSGSSLVDPALVKKVVDLYYRLPNLLLGEAMKLAGFNDEESNDIVLRRIIQRALPGGCIKSFWAIINAHSTPPPSRLMRYESRSSAVDYLLSGTSTTPAQATMLLNGAAIHTRYKRRWWRACPE